MDIEQLDNKIAENTNNVIFIKENHTLPDNLIQEIKEYEHLIEYGEYNKV